jgi:tetratricopeptide (TPR) repeat protein
MRIGDVQIAKLKDKVAKCKKAAESDPANAEKKKILQEAPKSLLRFQIQEYERRIKEHPTDMGLRFELGRFYYRGGKFDEAIKQFQLALKDPKRATDSLNFLGQCFMKKKMHKLAVGQFQKALEGAKTTEQQKSIRYSLIQALRLQGAKKEALTECEKILEVDISYKDVSQIAEQLRAEIGEG